METVLFLYVHDEEYGKRFLRFLLQKKHPMLCPELVTHYEMILDREETAFQQVVVLTDDKKVYEEEERTVILLGDEQSREKRKIFQYQKAEDIYDELLVQIGVEKVSISQEGTACDTKGVYAICSASRQESTVVSVMLSQYLGHRGNTLYLNLSEFPYYFGGELRKEADFAKKGIGELVFLSDRERFPDQMENCEIPFGKAKMLCPMPYYKDLLDCTAEDWQVILERLQKECGYEHIIIQMNELMEDSFPIMEVCDECFFLFAKGVMGRLEKEVFCHYCRLEKRSSLWERMRWFKIPEEIATWQEVIESQSLDDLAENAQALAIVDDWLKGEEEDVCIVENIG